ncbi:MAG: hypothetical protein IJE02_03300 [Clostridia bacterium]|nr:hypothetical protein [Clostridia bacterium]
MFKKVISVLLITSFIFCLTGCAQTKKPRGNVSFESKKEMFEALNGTWFSVNDSFTGPTYTEIVFNDDKIKQCQVYGWLYDSDTDEYKPQYNENINFEDYYGYGSLVDFDYKTGQILFKNNNYLDVDIKINKHTGDGKEIKEMYLKIGSRVYLKASDNTDLSVENFKTFQNFCAAAIFNKTYTLVGMSYQYKDEATNTEAGINYDNMFVFNDFDNEETSFDVIHRYYNDVHYMARTDEFEYLYNEIKDFYGHKTNIIALIGDDMPDFDKKEYYKNDRFRELKYYLYMNSEGKLVSNIDN